MSKSGDLADSLSWVLQVLDFVTCVAVKSSEAQLAKFVLCKRLMQCRGHERKHCNSASRAAEQALYEFDSNPKMQCCS